MRGLTLAAVLLTGAVTQAEIVIDTFDALTPVSLGASNGVSSSDTNTIANNVGRTVTIGTLVGSSSASLDIGAVSGELSGSLKNIGSFLELSYNFVGSTISRNFFVDQVLRTGLVVTSNAATNAFTRSITVTSAGNTTATFTGGTQMLEQENMLAEVSGLGGNGHLAAFANVDTLTIRWTKTTNAVTNFTSTTGVLAIPEPATMSLLGLTAIGGIFAHRRRKNQLAA